MSQPTSWCAQCGPMVAVDQDGLCATCGAMCMGDYADVANDMLALLKQIAQAPKLSVARQRARALLCRAYQVDSWAEVSP